MAFNIQYSTDYVFSKSKQKEIGKRVVILGTNESFDAEGYAEINMKLPDTSEYDFSKVDISNKDTLINMFGANNPIYYAYKSLGYAGVNAVTVIKVPCLKDDTSQQLVDREQFKANMVKAMRTLAESSDFDICVLCGIDLQTDYTVISSIADAIADDSFTKLILVSTTKASDDMDIWNQSITSSINSITSKSTTLGNICIVANNADFSTSIAMNPSFDIDYNNINVAAYVAGLIVMSNMEHPTLSKTIFNKLNTNVTDSRVSYFRKNAIRGIILSNFKTLGCTIEGKNVLNSAINVYRAAVILDTLCQRLSFIVGSINNMHSSYGSKTYIDDAIQQCLTSYQSSGLISSSKYQFKMNTLKMTLDINVELVMTYELESIKISSMVGV